MICSGPRSRRAHRSGDQLAQEGALSTTNLCHSGKQMIPTKPMVSTNSGHSRVGLWVGVKLMLLSVTKIGSQLSIPRLYEASSPSLPLRDRLSSEELTRPLQSIHHVRTFYRMARGACY